MVQPWSTRELLSSAPALKSNSCPTSAAQRHRWPKYVTVVAPSHMRCQACPVRCFSAPLLAASELVSGWDALLPVSSLPPQAPPPLPVDPGRKSCTLRVPSPLAFYHLRCVLRCTFGRPRARQPIACPACRKLRYPAGARLPTHSSLAQQICPH
ncbi:hypothetical protein GQ53DRAFT_96919 [Thozetella sp. PMI_491]|nr:hypothetical protein GQ53DRAFT_96919 [Thozetella sp. PMI_491]